MTTQSKDFKNIIICKDGIDAKFCCKVHLKLADNFFLNESHFSKVYSKPCQLSKMELFAKIVNDFQCTR